MSEVLLTWGEFQTAIFVGGQRMMRAVNKARSEPYGHPSERGDWEVVIEGDRGFVGCDIDTRAVETTQERLAA